MPRAIDPATVAPSDGRDGALTLWGRSTSSNVQKVVWLCHELGLAPTRILRGGPHGGLDDPAFLALNPNGTIPVLQDGPLVVWESHAILRYLASSHDPANWYGMDPATRAPVDMWLDWFSNVLWPPVRTLFRDVLPEERHEGGAGSAALTSARRAFSILDERLEGDAYLAGPEALTIADIAIAVGAARGTSLGCDMQLRPNVLRWLDAMTARDGYGEATANDPDGYVPPGRR